MSRQLGFLRFYSINESRVFLERNHPFIYLYGPSAGDNDRSTKVRIAYSREREDRARPKSEGDWTCRMVRLLRPKLRTSVPKLTTRLSVLSSTSRPGQNVFAVTPLVQVCSHFYWHIHYYADQTAPEIMPVGPPGAPAPKVVNNGDNDAAPENQPSQFLLFRGLDSSVTEELLAKGVAKLYRPTGGSNDGPSSNNPKKGAKVASTTGDSNLGAREGSIRRVLLVRDRRTNESWRFGFAEFANVLVCRCHAAHSVMFADKPLHRMRKPQ